ncbi:hypothetical protein PWP93_29230 [Paraburkholderia sp. A1RI-2L]|uniref:hypothetical protein n=1 Tax=Paraburkholderia sp. A1RI-2L TaxID=3028367 RepID=UPI003B81E8B0
MKSRRIFLQDAAEVGAEMMLSQARMVHAASVPGYVARLVAQFVAATVATEASGRGVVGYLPAA